MNKIMDKLNAVLKADAYFWDGNGEVIREKVKTAALSLDEHLMAVLTNDEELKKAFFTEQNGVLIFDKVQFSWFISSSEFLPDSYTVYKNKIGLIDTDRNFIKTCDDVALSFPYKDCILEFDSTDENEDRNEVFLNETLASSEIDSLLAPKVFVNAQLHDKDGTNTVESYDGQNLVIKGNNLIALYSLLPKFEGRVKLIYWDILYNTDNDNVPYNDSFKHSSWLTMMKNRLTIAKQLLKDDGFICIQCDKNEDAYLTVLMDEIFCTDSSRSNHICTIAVRSNSISGVKTAHKYKTILKNKDSILVYKKGNVVIEPQYTIKDKWDSHYNAILVQEGAEVKKVSLKEFLVKENIIDSKFRMDENALSHEGIKSFVLQNADRICQTVGSINPEKKKLSLEKPDTVITWTEDDETYYAYNGRRVSFLSKTLKEIDGKRCFVQLLGDLWTDIDFQNTQNEGGVDLPAGKKPEALIKRILDMTTKEGDLVLDAYFGTGTTGAVALKTGRRFIGIEQLDSHFEKAVTRLSNVVSGEQSGISRYVGWQGGGNFISCELAKDNLRYFDMISTLDDKGTIDLFNELLGNPLVLCHSVDVKKAKDNAEAFEQLPLDDKKKVLISMLEKNTLYVSYSDIDDEEKAIIEEDKKFSKTFYGE